MRQKHVILLRNIGVGVVATGVDLATLTLLIRGLHWTPAQANLPALLMGGVCQFIGSKYFAFQDRSRQLLRQGGWFTVVEIGAFWLNAALFQLFAVYLSVPYTIARLVGTALVYFGFSLPLWTRIFRASHDRSPADSEAGRTGRND